MIGAIAMLMAMAAILTTPQGVVGAFGKWGWERLLAVDARVRLLNGLAGQETPLSLSPGALWPADAQYLSEVLRCDTTQPLAFTLVRQSEPTGAGTAVTWQDDHSFSYMVKGAPIRITVTVIEATTDAVTVSISAAQTQ
jgi:hypothetical protein